MKTWVLILLIPVCRLLINLNAWRYLAKALRKHHQYIKGIPGNANKDEKEASRAAAGWLTSNLTEIKRRVQAAGVQNPTHRFMEPAGYGHLVPQSMTALDNILFHNEDILTGANQALSLAAGHYKTQAILSINPLYWLEVVFFLPKQLVSASGIEVTSKVAEIGLKLVQIAYWIAIVLTLLFKPEVLKILLNNV